MIDLDQLYEREEICLRDLWRTFTEYELDCMSEGRVTYEHRMKDDDNKAPKIVIEPTPQELRIKELRAKRKKRMLGSPIPNIERDARLRKIQDFLATIDHGSRIGIGIVCRLCGIEDRKQAHKDITYLLQCRRIHGRKNKMDYWEVWGKS